MDRISRYLLRELAVTGLMCIITVCALAAVASVLEPDLTYLFSSVAILYIGWVVIEWTRLAVRFYLMDREFYGKYPDLWEENK